jgi:integrase
MAEIFRPVYSTTDPKTGRKVKRKSRRWWIRFYTPDGVRHKVKGYLDRKATESLAAELVKRGERLAGGLATPYDEHGKTPLREHLDHYRGYLTAKGNTPGHVKKTLCRILACVDGCGFVKIEDVQPSAVVSFLADLRATGKSIKTANYYLTAAKGFTRWLWRDRRAAADPLAGMTKLAHEETEVRHARRDFTPEEFDLLLQTARASAHVWRDLAGADRFHLYLTAAATGLRAAELESLTPESFDLDAGTPVVRCTAAYAKNRKEAEQPLPLDVAGAMRAYLDGKPAGTPVWPGTWKDMAAAMLRKDLADARSEWLQSFQDARQRDEMAKSDFLTYRDRDGRVTDFHALRHTYISRIVSGGATAKVAQHLARHSTVQLTLGRYAHAAAYDVAAAVNDLPSILPAASPSSANVGALRATGTDGPQTAGKGPKKRTEKPGPFLGPQSEKTGYKAGQSGTEAAASDGPLAASKTPDKSRKSNDFHGAGVIGPARIRTENQGIMSPLL